MHQIPRRDRADGVIILSLSPRDEDLPFLQRSEVPIVLVDANHPSLSSLNRVIVDDVAGGRTATQHLIDLGHRGIGFIGGDTRFSSNHDRWQGYLQAMAAANIEVEDALVKLGTTRSLWGEQAAGELTSLPHPPTAMFVASNAMMPGVLKTLRQRAIRLPEQMSLIARISGGGPSPSTKENSHTS